MTLKKEDENYITISNYKKTRHLTDAEYSIQVKPWKDHGWVSIIYKFINHHVMIHPGVVEDFKKWYQSIHEEPVVFTLEEEENC